MKINTIIILPLLPTRRKYKLQPLFSKLLIHRITNMSNMSRCFVFHNFISKIFQPCDGFSGHCSLQNQEFQEYQMPLVEQESAGVATSVVFLSEHDWKC